MRTHRDTCEVCGSPVQTRIVRLEPGPDRPDPGSTSVQTCTSLLCPTNLADGSASWPTSMFDEPDPAQRPSRHG